MIDRRLFIPLTLLAFASLGSVMVDPNTVNPGESEPAPSSGQNESLVELSRLVERLETDEALRKQADTVYQNACAMCHGEDLTGGPMAQSLLDGDWEYTPSLEEVLHSVRNGIDGTQMPSWDGMLTKEQVKLVSAYVWQRAQKAEQAR